MLKKYYILKFWETFLKSKTTRDKFVSILVSNLRKRCRSINISNRSWYLLATWEVDTSLIKNVFGLEKIEEINVFDLDCQNITKEVLIEKVFGYAKSLVWSIDFDTFRVTASREYKNIPINSIELQWCVWKNIEDKLQKTVSLKKYDLNIIVRVLKSQIWIRTNNHITKWVWWLPLGSGWKTLMLMSWWIDSPVSSFLLAKRWIAQKFLLFDIIWSKLLYYQIHDILSLLRQKYWIEWELHIINWTEIIRKIKSTIDDWYRQVIFKRLLYQVASHISTKMNIDSFALWENLWQVSTQTLDNMQIIQKSTDKLVLRPVLTYDKIEIINIASKIWTLDYSNKIKETCNIETHSNAKAKLEKILLFEKRIKINISEYVEKNTNIFEYNQQEKESIDSLASKDTKNRQIIDLTKLQWDLSLDKKTKYIFTCDSRYNSSKLAIEWASKWYDVKFQY